MTLGKDELQAIKDEDHGAEIICQSAKTSMNFQKLTWRNSSMTKLNSSFMIGNVEIPHRTVLAPMAGVTNSAFRTIAKEFGAGLVVMEMISEKRSPLQ